MSSMEKMVTNAVKAAQKVNGATGPLESSISGDDSSQPPKLESLTSGGSGDEDTSKGTKRKAKEEMTESELHEERKAANRRSAYQSRLRKKLLIEELQGKVDHLSQQLNTTKDEKKSLQVQLESALAENRQLRFDQQALMMSGAGGAPGGAGLALMGANPALLSNFTGTATGNIPSAATSNPSVAALLSELQQQQQNGRSGETNGINPLNGRPFSLGPL